MEQFDRGKESCSVGLSVSIKGHVIVVVQCQSWNCSVFRWSCSHSLKFCIGNSASPVLHSDEADLPFYCYNLVGRREINRGDHCIRTKRGARFADRDIYVIVCTDFPKLTELDPSISQVCKRPRQRIVVSVFDVCTRNNPQTLCKPLDLPIFPCIMRYVR